MKGNGCVVSERTGMLAVPIPLTTRTTMHTRSFPALALLPVLALPLTAFAHHSFFGRFDTGNVMYLEGEVTRVQWRNPHAHIFLTTTAEDGTVTEWDMESGSPTLMFRAGIPSDAIQTGMTIRVAGYPPLTETKEMFATNVQLPSGQELVLQSSESVITERFTVLAEGSELQYEMQVNDPVMFTSPVNLHKKMLYVPGEEIIPFECAEP